ncbi:rCG51676 [Rattus norvegicus]|uniref:RCG51676 n=1 Tax=Rattus norvegicus TaxID=10116 RepID=A6IYA4_RAT|nr:rCG51676 [Rattus norvegicus]
MQNQIPMSTWREQQPLFFQRTQVQFPAPTWLLTSIYNSSSRGPVVLLDMHTGKTPVCNNK